jgi:hypothetical protein
MNFIIRNVGPVYEYVPIADDGGVAAANMRVFLENRDLKPRAANSIAAVSPRDRPQR